MSKVLKTTDYSKFKYIETNRPLHISSVLRESLQEVGFIEESPMVVNQHFEILDGQHRLNISAELGIPVFYKVRRTSGRDEDNKIIRLLNRCQQQWRLAEFIHSFAEEGVRFHKEVRDFNERYKLGMTNSIVICAGQKAEGDSIRKGVDIKLWSKRDACAEFILSCGSLHFHKSAYFVSAVVTLHNKANQAQLKKVLKRHLSIPRQPSLSDYLTVFANVINKNNPNNKISL